MGADAMQGISGEVVRTMGPHTEADPAGLVLQNLIAFGNAVGGGPHSKVAADRHAFNLFLAEVGQSAKARKGVGAGLVMDIYRKVDTAWTENRIQTGLRTGEGLVLAVRDGTGDEPGELDKRLLAFESEMAALLRVMGRTGNSLSPTLRQAWDGGTLGVRTRRLPLRATRPHISIIAHSTLDDLSRFLDRTDIFNGFANRFLWACVRRARLLPLGGAIPEDQLDTLIRHTRDALEFAKGVQQLRFSEKAAELWREEYPELTADVPGMVGAATSRAEAQVLRLAGIYALMDQCGQVKLQHLRAALAVWKFCFDSAKYIFAGRSTIGLDQRLEQILQMANGGLTRTEISAAFNHHHSTAAISAALERLRKKGFAAPQIRSTKGRPSERWCLVNES